VTNQSKLKKQRNILFALLMTLLPAVLAAAPVEKVWHDSEWGVLRIANRERMKQGLLPMSTTQALQQAAGIRANELIKTFEHTRPDGRSALTVLNEFKISYNTAGENIASGQSSPASVMRSWMNSPGHKANILNKAFSHMSVGYVSVNTGYQHYWVQLFTGGCQITNIAVGSVADTPVFKLGQDIDDLDLVVVLTCNHIKAYMPLIAEMCKGYNKNNTAIQTVTVTYGSLVTTFSLSLEQFAEQSAEPPITPAAAPQNVTVTVPAAPQNFTAAPGNRQVALSWDAPSNNGGSVITGYQVSSNNGSTWVTASSNIGHTFTGLTNSSSYTFMVRAVNSAGNGATAAVTAAPRVGDAAPQNAAVPSAPQNFTAVPGNRQVTLSWDAPSSNGGNAITGYQVSNNNGFTWVTASGSTRHTFTGLTNGTSYTFKVRAVNWTGFGAESVVTGTPRN
jgi:uncharacterized protein YkwD